MSPEQPRETAAGIRPARRGDEPRIAALAGQLGYPAAPEEIRLRLESILENPAHALYVSEDAEAWVTGWVHVFLHQAIESAPRAEVGGLVVDSARRGRGVGQLLMERAEQWAREHGCREVSLRSNVVREEAHRFYQRLGYRIVKTQHAFRKSVA